MRLRIRAPVRLLREKIALRDFLYGRKAKIVVGFRFVLLSRVGWNVLQSNG